MEVHSAQKRAKPVVTIVAALILLAVAILQSIALEVQKSDHWLAQLGPATEKIDDQLSVRIPRGWKRESNLNSWVDATSDADSPLSLLILRPPPGSITTMREACELVFEQGLDSSGVPSIGGFDEQPCRLGPYPAQLVIATQQVTRSKVRVRVVLLSLSQELGTTIMVMIPGVQEDIQRAKYLLLKMGETATIKHAAAP